MKQLSLDGSRARRNAQEADTWNIFVQILLPLIIVLSFVAMLEISRFKHGFDERGQIIEDLRVTLEQMQDAIPEAREREHQKALLEEQLQKLLLALDVVLSGRRESLGFSRVPRVDTISIEGSSIKDEAFKALCRNLRDIGSLASFEKRIFDEVLAKAGVSDSARFDPQPAYQSKHSTGPNVITLDNKKRVTDRISESVAAMHTNLQQMQQEILSRLFAALVATPDALDPKIVALARSLTDARSSPADQTEAARSLSRYLNDRVRRSLTRDGYEFLDKTWEAISL